MWDPRHSPAQFARTFSTKKIPMPLVRHGDRSPPLTTKKRLHKKRLPVGGCPHRGADRQPTPEDRRSLWLRNPRRNQERLGNSLFVGHHQPGQACGAFDPGQKKGPTKKWWSFQPSGFAVAASGEVGRPGFSGGHIPHDPENQSGY